MPDRESRGTGAPTGGVPHEPLPTSGARRPAAAAARPAYELPVIVDRGDLDVAARFGFEPFSAPPRPGR